MGTDSVKIFTILLVVILLITSCGVKSDEFTNNVNSIDDEKELTEVTNEPEEIPLSKIEFSN